MWRGIKEIGISVKGDDCNFDRVLVTVSVLVVVSETLFSRCEITILPLFAELLVFAAYIKIVNHIVVFRCSFPAHARLNTTTRSIFLLRFCANSFMCVASLNRKTAGSIRSMIRKWMRAA